MNRFAFIIHPLELNDITRKYSWANRFPDPVINGFTRVLPPVTASHITGIRSKDGKEIDGYFIGCVLTAKQMLTLPARKVIKKIVKAGKKAEELGAQIVGLGAFTSVVGDKGITVARELDIPVTTGNSYTVATAIDGTRLAAEKMGYQMEEISVSIIGATGSIGRAISLIISRDIRKLIMVARSKEKLRLLREEIRTINPDLEISYTTDVDEALKTSKIIISASGAVEALIKPQNILPGSIICDVARPRDVAALVASERNDVLVIEGGIVKVPGEVNFNFNFGYPPGTAYACMAETMLLTLEERFENYSIGQGIELEKVTETAIMAEKHGFKLAGLRSFERALTEEKINEIKKEAGKSKLVRC